MKNKSPTNGRSKTEQSTTNTGQHIRKTNEQYLAKRSSLMESCESLEQTTASSKNENRSKNIPSSYGKLTKKSSKHKSNCLSFFDQGKKEINSEKSPISVSSNSITEENKDRSPKYCSCSSSNDFPNKMKPQDILKLEEALSRAKRKRFPLERDNGELECLKKVNLFAPVDAEPEAPFKTVTAKAFSKIDTNLDVNKHVPVFDKKLDLNKVHAISGSKIEVKTEDSDFSFDEVRLKKNTEVNKSKKCLNRINVKDTAQEMPLDIKNPAIKSLNDQIKFEAEINTQNFNAEKFVPKVLQDSSKQEDAKCKMDPHKKKCDKDCCLSSFCKFKDSSRVYKSFSQENALNNVTKACPKPAPSPKASPKRELSKLDSAGPSTKTVSSCDTSVSSVDIAVLVSNVISFSVLFGISLSCLADEALSFNRMPNVSTISFVVLAIYAAAGLWTNYNICKGNDICKFEKVYGKISVLQTGFVVQCTAVELWYRYYSKQCNYGKSVIYYYMVSCAVFPMMYFVFETEWILKGLSFSVASATGVLLSVSILNKNAFGVGAAVAFCLSAINTQLEKKNNFSKSQSITNWLYCIFTILSFQAVHSNKTDLI